MKLDLYINEANDYARDIHVPVLHPHVAIIHYDEAGEIRHTLNRINCYGIFLQREFPENLTYGIGTYHEGDGSLMAYSPGQIGGKRDDGTRRQYHGWVLLFDPVFIHGTEIEQRMKDYHFFSYNSNEALFLKPQEKDILAGLMENIRTELMEQREQNDARIDSAESRQKSSETQLQSDNSDEVQDDIVRDYIRLILDYCNRFYTRQFNEIAAGRNDILTRFRQVLIDYYEQGKQRTEGLPSVKYCASELCLSPGYFGDVVRNALAESPKDYIRGFVIMRAKNLMMSGKSIDQVADELGFEYPQHFTRMFKNSTGQTPREFLNQSSGRIKQPVRLKIQI